MKKKIATKEEYEKIDGVRVPKQQKLNKESPTRSVLKAISWRIIASATTFIVFYVAVGKEEAMEIILAAVGIEAITKMVIYYFHERAWTNIDWGKSWMKNKLIRRIKLNYILWKRKRKNT